MHSEDKPLLPLKKRCSSTCQNHQFSFFSEQNNQFNCCVKLCPKYHREPRSPQNTFPTFNRDQKYFTSAFILEVDRKTLLINQHQQLGQHLRQIRQSSEKEIKILFPKPNKKNSWCMTCKIKYKSYFKHIIDEKHKNNTNDSKYNLEINSLTNKFIHLHNGATASPIIIIRLQNRVNNQNNQKETHQQQQELFDFKDIEQLIISSDSQDQQKQMESEDTQRQKNSKQCENQGSSKSDDESDQQLAKKQAPQLKDQIKNQCSQSSQSDQQDHQKGQENSDSVEIIAVKPPKQPRNVKKQQIVQKQKKIVKQKNKKNHKSKKSKKSKSKKSKSEKHKKKKKSSKQSRHRERDSSEESRQRRKNSNKRRPLDPPPSTPPLIHRRMAYRGAHRNALPPESRSEVVLIEKIAIGGLVQSVDKQFQKVLDGVISSINKSPPAQAPRQYRKTPDFIDSRVAPNTRITQINPTTNNLQKMVNQSYQQKLNSIFQIRQSLQPFRVTAKQPSVAFSQISNQQSIRDKGRFIKNGMSRQQDSKIIQVLDQQQDIDSSSILAKTKETAISTPFTENTKQTKVNEIIDIQNIEENKSIQKPNSIPLNINPKSISLGAVQRLLSQTQQQINRISSTNTNRPLMFPSASNRYLKHSPSVNSNITKNISTTLKNHIFKPNSLHPQLNQQNMNRSSKNDEQMQRNQHQYKQRQSLNNGFNANEPIKKILNAKNKEEIIDLQGQSDQKQLQIQQETDKNIDSTQIIDHQDQIVERGKQIINDSISNKEDALNFNK